MHTDITRWDEKYAGAAGNGHTAVASVLLRYSQLFDGRGDALDVACGLGQNTRYLARRGYHVLGVDGSLVALKRCRASLREQPEAPRVALVVADLDAFVLPEARFDVMLVARYLSRPLVPQLKAALRPGGLLAYETFNRNLLAEKRGFNPEYLLDPGELAGMFEDFHVIDTNDSADIGVALSYWIGRKP